MDKHVIRKSQNPSIKGSFGVKLKVGWGVDLVYADKHLYVAYPNQAHCHKAHKTDVILLSNTIVQPLNKTMKYILMTFEESKSKGRQ